MISFYPGPSRVHSEIPKYFKDAYQSGILSINHRDKEFSNLYKDTVSLLRKKLNVPSNYMVFFTSSATENWEIFSQSLTKKSSIHIFSGAFGDKWYNYARNIHADCKAFKFDMNERPSVEAFKLPRNPEMICLTHNETSNGTQLEWKFIRDLRNTYPKSLICIDATSSMGGINLRFKLADAWYASVQKCFGLPAGMGVMICSPNFISRSKRIGESGRYNSFSFLLQNAEKWQTPYTPNVANVYLLNRVLNDSENIREVDKRLVSRYNKWLEVFESQDKFQLLISNDSTRSRTVLAVQGEPQEIDLIKEKAKVKNFLLGNGYGELKKTTFRIANFPALMDKEVASLQKFIFNYS